MDSSNYRYIERYNLLEEAFAYEQYRECVRFAKHLLADGNMPRPVHIKTCVLVACATDDPNEAELYRMGAETAWRSARQDADKNVRDEQTEEFLAQMREELDSLEPLSVYQKSSVPRQTADGRIEMQDTKWSHAANELDKIEQDFAKSTVDETHLIKVQELLDSLKI